MSHFNGRLREAARLQWHCEYGGNIPAMMRSGEKLKTMALTDDEQRKVDAICEWMHQQVIKKDRWW